MFRSALFSNLRRNASLFAILVTFSIAGRDAGAQAQPAIFANPTQIALPNGGTPHFIGDFNGDGLPDLAFTSVSSPTLSIMLDFAGKSPTTVSTTVCPQALFADVNNDKKLDAVSNCNGYITVQLGNGDATFQAATYYAVNGGPLLVDLNGDGYLDIAATLAGTQSAPQVAVLLNNGSSGPGYSGLRNNMHFPRARPAWSLGTLMETASRTCSPPWSTSARRPIPCYIRRRQTSIFFSAMETGHFVRQLSSRGQPTPASPWATLMEMG